MRITTSLCSTLAIATTLLLPRAASAQSLAGTPSVQAGTATVTTGGPTTTVTVSTPQAVINWTPADNAVGTGTTINFQPAGTSARFVSGTGGDFAVLNRILPADTSRQIGLNGQIQSFLTLNAQAGVGATGGTVWFYSPSGFVIGGNAVVDVGSFGLTTADPWSGRGDWLASGTNGLTATMGGSLPGGSIVTLAGSRITTASSASSYTAIVAPRITHSGTVTTSGAAALIAAEGATVTFRPSNLFDIQVTAGSTNGTGILVDGGTITGPASTAAADTQRIYLVAVPKNNAMTMLIQGGADLGFTPATSASVDGSAIVLSGGRNLGNGVASTDATAATGSLIAQNATFRNKVAASLTGSAALQSLGGNLSFGGELDVRAGGNVSLVASGAGRSVSVAGGLLVYTDRRGSQAAPNATAGTILLNASSGGSISVGGETYLSAMGYGLDSRTAGVPGGTGRGGSVSLAAQGGGTIDLGNDLLVFADGYGATTLNGGASAAGFGGGVTISASGPGSRLSVDGSVQLKADGLAGGLVDSLPNVTVGAAGTGGSVSLIADGNGGLIDLASDASLTASGFGSTGRTGPGGNATGGNVGVTTNGGTIRVAGGLDLAADAFGGSAAGNVAGGTATGGGARLYTSQSGDLLAVGGTTGVSATGSGGSAIFSTPGAAGGAGQGGIASVEAEGGSVQLGSLLVMASGAGGYSEQGRGGNGTGGFALVEAVTGGALAINGSADLLASGFGGEGIVGGDGTGGGIYDSNGRWLTGGAQFYARQGTITVASASVEANGEGGNGRDGGRGGTGRGGAAFATTNDSDAGPARITVSGVESSLNIIADGSGGSGGDATGSGLAGGAGGDGYGGRVLASASSGNGALQADFLYGQANGRGGDGGAGGAGTTGGTGGAGGNGEGGFVQAGTFRGTTPAGNSGRADFAGMALVANGYGGFGGDGGSGTGSAGLGGAGGNARNGAAVLYAYGSPVTTGLSELEASAFGGDGGTGGSNGAGGMGAGGTADIGSGLEILVSDRAETPGRRGSLQASAIVAIAEAVGGQGPNGSVGGSTDHGGNSIGFINSDATLGALDVTVAAASSDSAGTPDRLSLDGSTVTISRALSVETPGRLSVTGANAGLLTAGSINLDAANFAADPNASGPANAATYAAGSWTIGTESDFVVTANLRSATDLALFVPGSIATYGIDARDIRLRSGAAMQLGALTARNAVSLESGTTLTSGSITAGDTIFARATGAVQAGDLSAGLVNRSTAPGATYRIGLHGAQIAAGNVATASTAELTAQGGGVSAGNVAAPGGLLVLANGNVVLGSIATDPAAGVFIADDGMIALGGQPGPTFNAAAVTNAAPQATSGALTIGGAVSTGRLRAYVGQNASFAGAVNATQSAQVSAGGAIAIDGAWTSPSIDLSSADITIGASGRLTAGGLLRLTSTNPTQMLVGDGLSGTGYALSNAEAARLAGQSIELVGRGDATADPDIAVGTLAIAGSQIGSTGYFGIGTPAGAARSGVLRVSGTVTATGFGLDQSLAVRAARFELDTATGSVSITGQNNRLAGALDILADRVWAAEPTVLTRLAANPDYAGREADINRPAAVARRDGVLRAAEISVFDARQILVQNTGTATLPAGVLVTDGEILASSGTGLPPPAEVILNGQIDINGGLITGLAARDAVIGDDEFEPGLYAGNSSINGCLLLAASCGQDTEVPGLDTRLDDLQLGDANTLEDREFGDEGGDEGDDEEGDSADNAPIAPPEKLVDGRPLDRDQIVEEPVTGSGNPALVDSQGGEK